VGAAWPARGAAEDEDCHGSRECTVWSLRHALSERLCAMHGEKHQGIAHRTASSAHADAGLAKASPAALTSSIVVHAAAGATSRRENMAGALLRKGPS
jgi:hypothetical protein